MERRYLNLGKPPSKLRYFNLERAQCQRKGDVVRNIEVCFDEFDLSREAGSQLSPLSKTASSAEDEDEVQPLVLSLQIFESEGDGLIRTSSPIEMLRNEGSRDGHVDVDDIRASPLLFDKVYGDPDPQSELKEPSKCTDNAREPQEASSAFSAHAVAEDPKSTQGSKVGPLTGGKEASGFLLKLKDAGRPKAASSWKQHSPVAVSAQPDPEEDFLIMDDEEFAVPDRIFIRKRPNPHKNDDGSDCQQREVGEDRRVVQDGTEIPNEASSGTWSPTQTRTKTGKELQASGKTKSGRVQREKDADLDVECSVPTEKTKLGKVRSENDIDSDRDVERSVPTKKTKLGKVRSKNDVDHGVERSVPTKKTKLGKVRSENDIDSDRDVERSVPTKKTKLGKVRSENDIDSDRDVECSVPTKKTKLGKVRSENDIDGDREVEHSIPTKKTKLGKVQSKNDVDHDVEHSVSTKKTKSGKVARVPQIASTNQHGILTAKKGKNSKMERAEKQAGRIKLKRISCQNLSRTDAASGGPDDPGEEVIDQDAGRDSSWLRAPAPGEEEDNGHPQLTSTEDPCKRQEGSDHSSDIYEGKRMRRKPGSWWLINQDGDEEGDDNAVERGRGHQERVGLAPPNRKQWDRHASSKKNATGSSVEAVRNQAKENSTKSCKLKPAGWPHPPASDRHSPSQAADCEHMQNSERKAHADGLRTHRKSSRSPIQQGSQHGVQGGRLGNKCRKASSNWWEVPRSAAMYEDSGSPPHCSPKPTRRRQEEACSKMPHKDQPPRRALNDTGNAWKRGNAKQQTQPAAWDSRNLPPPQNSRTSLASFDAIYTPGKAVTRGLPQRPLQAKYTAPRRSLSPVDDVPDTIDKLDDDLEPSIPTVSLVTSPVVQTAKNRGAMLCLGEQSTDMEGLIGFRSGPSSFIEKEDSENTRAQFVENVMDIPSEGHMCNPPLSPIHLQVEDRAELVKWLNSVWCSPGGSPIITPEHFRWYGYHGRAMGCRTDLKSNTFSSGKILLGSYMKKPPQVDSQAVSVYNILTSSLSVKVNGVESCVSSGQTFMVPRGHPFEMRNLTAEPAVLFFHRMLSDAV
ncbi:uncharacterized protein si:ch211-161h7.4 isoform X2 [Brienomyrus brachyistius]|uniref:uncharacterized protein si:ch211-161h7.4 isoform X2 n=1 Tax=Brienomyrus brachyistius TaxID=42636 RepID=UPI0020B27E01|nr:uncharacterized protein si:ch211-161h7.4 isoform X2 [Brienomyrus brachyistius]